MIKVGIIGGGPSSEHEVSLNSAANVFKEIDRKKYEPTLLTLTKNKVLLSGKTKLPFPEGLKQFDIVFNALHGTFGEDGELQRILDKTGVRYTGSEAKASELGMDKWKSKLRFKNAGLTVAKAKLVTKISHADFPLPTVVKPRRGGSSVGVSIANDERELRSAIKKVLKGDEVVLEKYIRGREFTVGVLERNGKTFALPIIEIRPKAKYEFFDYEAKYTTDASEEIVPAHVSNDLARRLENAGIRAHKAVGARVYSRSDFIYDGKNIYILEINTLPGLTKNSLVPKAARAAGISFPQLIDLIITASLR